MDPDRMRDLVAGLSSQDVQACVQAAKSLQAEATSEDIPALLTLLEDNDFFVREAAAWPLAVLAGPEVLPQLLTAYQQGFDQGHDNDGFTAALLEIPALFPSESKASLEALAAAAQEPLKGHAAWLLQFVPPGTR